MIISSFAGYNLDEVSTHSRNDTIYTLSEKRFSRLIYVQASNSRDNSHTRSFTFAPSVLSDTMQRVFSGESLNCFLSPPTNESLTYQTLLRSQTEQGKNLAILQSPLILDLKNNIL